MQHFLCQLDWPSQDLKNIIDDAIFLKREHKTGGNRPALNGKSLAMIFQKPSLRTRVSFELAMQHVGGYAFYLSPQEIGLLGQRESIADIARVLGSYANGIMARVSSHTHLLELAKWSPVPIINGLSDYNHPCQAMADILTIYEEFGHFNGLKIAYLGDANNVCRSLLFSAAKFGIQFIFSGPSAYSLDAESIQKAKAVGGADAVQIISNPTDAVRHADVIYTDTWTSMGQEEEAAERRKVFPPYAINQELVSHAPQHAIVMHCLPAHRGEEITDSIADGPQSRLFPQAENRLHAQKAILLRLLS